MIQREQIGLRVPSNVNERLQQKANAMGVSVNALILMLIDIGLTAWDNSFILRPQEREG